MRKASAAAWVSLALCAWVAIHEWLYHEQHSYRPGPSAVIAALGLAGVLIAAAVLVALREIERNWAVRAADSISTTKQLGAIKSEIQDLAIAVSAHPESAALLAATDPDDE